MRVVRQGYRGGWQQWLLDLRLKQGPGASVLLLLSISLLVSLALVAGYDEWLFGGVERVDMLVVAMTAPPVTLLMLAIVNPFISFIFRMQRRIAISQHISGIGSWEWTAADDSVDYSEETQRIFALEKACNCFPCMQDRVIEADRQRVADYLAAACAGHPPGAIEFAIDHPQLGRRTLRMDSAPLPTVMGRAGGVIGTVSDVSERSEAQEARIQAEASLRNLLTAIEQSPDALMLLDTDGNIEFANAAASRISGYPPEELLGQPALFMRPQGDGSEPHEGIVRQLRRGNSWHGRLQEQRRDGSVYPCYCFISPIADEQGNITRFVCNQQDLSEKETLEKQLEHAQKMEALGTLVGGIAHDFNNMLGGITSNLFLARSMAGNDSRLLEKLKQADALCFRSADMIRQLLAFARCDTVAMKDMSLNPFIKEALKLHASAVPENIRMELRPCAAQALVYADAGQIQQILLNLLNNACRALRDTLGPRIVIRTEVVEPDQALLAGHPEADSPLWFCLSVADNGEGIAAKHKHRIFEPYFTTRPVGEGSGLGLSMVYGAVRRHGGFVSVESHEGEGTSVKIFLPLSPRQPKAGELLLQAGDEVPRGQGETVLLVDDEDSFVEAHRNVLSMLGYRTLTARNGYEAVRLFAENPTGIDLVLTDVVMPEMGGVEAAGHMRAIRPNVPVLFVTGYESGAGSRPMLDDSDTVLTKPFSVSELSSALRAHLDSRKTLH